jgi:hypothetical protein
VWPELAIADGALGFWKAPGEIWRMCSPSCRNQPDSWIVFGVLARHFDSKRCQ